MKKKKLKLYVWTDFCSDYTPGLAFAIAKSEEEAREMIKEERPYVRASDWGELTIYPLTKKVAFSVYGGG